MSAIGLLGVALVILKLLHYIALSWWFVLLPFYGPAIVAIVFIFVIAVGEALTSRPRFPRYPQFKGFKR